MAYEFKKLSAVEAVEAASDTANVLIEENGVIKKTTMNSVGSVKSVNGVSPDENGNVEMSVASSWNDLADKPFYEETRYITHIEEQTVTCTASGNYANGTVNIISSIPYNGICKVALDGVVYDNIAAYESGGDMCTYVDFTTTDGNKISICNEDNSIRMPVSMAGNHTIKLEVKKSTIAPLDAKYIPTHMHDAGTELSGVLPISNGGTGAYRAEEARKRLGIMFGYCETAPNVAKKVITGMAKSYLNEGALVIIDFSFSNNVSSPELQISGTTYTLFNFKTHTHVMPGEMGATTHLFVFNGTYFMLLNPLT